MLIHKIWQVYAKQNQIYLYPSLLDKSTRARVRLAEKCIMPKVHGDTIQSMNIQSNANQTIDSKIQYCLKSLIFMQPQNKVEKILETHYIHWKDSSIKYFKINDKLSKYERDIIPGQYQGGMKLWDCQLDLLKYMQNNNNLNFNGKKVIEIGCGHGLLGIAALKLGASTVTFHDYNQDVIQEITIPTIKMNCGQLKWQCASGDWINLKDSRDYDIVLGSQLIYRQQNYEKVIIAIKKLLKPDLGICILANKHYYFGVGGNMPAFKDKLDQYNLKWNTLEKIVAQIGGNKKEIISIVVPED